MDTNFFFNLTDEQVARYFLALTFIAFFFPIIFRFGKRRVKNVRTLSGKMVTLYQTTNAHLLRMSQTKNHSH